MKKWLLLILGVAIVSGVFIYNPPQPPNYYFPTLTFTKIKSFDESTVSEFTRELEKMKEPNLYNMNSNEDKTIFRMLCMPSFRDSFVVRVEIDRANDTGILTYKKYRNVVGDFIETRQQELSSQELKFIEESMNKSDFWNESPPNPLWGHTLDGVELVYERRENGKYHVIARSFDRDEPEKVLREFFMTLCDIGEKDLH